MDVFLGLSTFAAVCWSTSLDVFLGLSTFAAANFFLSVNLGEKVGEAVVVFEVVGVVAAVTFLVGVATFLVASAFFLFFLEASMALILALASSCSSLSCSSTTLSLGFDEVFAFVAAFTVLLAALPLVGVDCGFFVDSAFCFFVVGTVRGDGILLSFFGDV